MPSINYLDQSTIDGITHRLFTFTPSKHKSFPCVNQTSVLTTLAQFWTNHTVQSSVFILLDNKLSFCTDDNDSNRQNQQVAQEQELMDDIILQFKSSFTFITAPGTAIPTWIHYLKATTGGHHYNIQPQNAATVRQIIAIHHQTPYKWYQNQFNDASAINMNLYGKTIQHVIMVVNNRLVANVLPTRSITLASQQFIYAFDKLSGPAITFIIINVNFKDPNIYIATDQPIIEDLKFYPNLKPTRKQPLLLPSPIDGKS